MTARVERRVLAVVAVALAGCAPRGSAERPPAAPHAAAAAKELTPAARLERAERELAASRYREAEEDFRAVLEQPGVGRAEIGLAELLLTTGRLDEAIQLADRAAKSAAELRERAACVKAEALRQLGKAADAEALLEPWSRVPEARAARLALAEIRLETGRRKLAEPLLLGIIDDYNSDRIAETDGVGLSLAARAAWLLRSPRDANTLFDAAEAAKPGDARTLLWRTELFLEKYDPGHAEETLSELMKQAPYHPQALTWLAHVRLDQALDFDEAERLARAALAANPKLAAAHFVLAGIALRDMELERADRFIDQGLAGAPRDLPLLSLRAVVRFLADDPPGFERAKKAVLELNPEYSELYAILGEYADWEHRYDEIVVLMREALAIDAEDSGALAQLGFNLIRAGQEGDGVSALSRAFSLDPYNVRVFNTLNLFDTVIPKAYVSVKTPRFVIRYHKADQPLLERYVPKLLDQAFDAMKQGYGFAPEIPVGVELYAERQSFAIRTGGLPQTAIQGVCFGKTLASMSPQHETFNLGMTLWHELSHVFHIQLSKSRVPRWFTEGLAEYETLVTRPEWTREHDPELYDMERAGKLPSVSQMSRAFTRAAELRDVATAYYASSQIVEMLANRHGRLKMAEMLRLWGQGLRTEQVFQKALGTSPDAVDRDFRAELSRELARYTTQFVPQSRARARPAIEAALRASPKSPDLEVELGLSLARAGEDDQALAAVESALRIDPKHAQARFLRARLAVERNEPERAEKLLRAMVTDKQSGYAVEVALAMLARSRGDTASARAALELAHRSDPTQAEPLEALAEIAAEQKVFDDELEKLEKLSRLSEHAADVHRRLMRRLIDAKRIDDAVRAGEAAVWVDVNGWETHALFGEALAQKGDLARARFELESALLCPANPEDRAAVHLRLADVLTRLKLPAEAKKHEQQAKTELSGAR